MELPVIVTLVAFAMFAQGAPYMGYQGDHMQYQNDLVKAALARNWDELHRQLERQSRFQLSPSGEVRDLRPIKNGRFYAESESSFYHAVNDNGMMDEQSGGHKVVNNNGRVQEYDFQPPRPMFSGI